MKTPQIAPLPGMTPLGLPPVAVAATTQVIVSHFDRDTQAHVDVAVVTIGRAGMAPLDACERAWALTQNLMDSWSRRGDMIARLVDLPVHNGETYGLRSSDVGDHFTVNGETYRCASFGFERVEAAA